MVAADERRARDAGDRHGTHPRRAGRCDVDEVVRRAAQRLRQLRDAGHPDPQAGVEGDVDLCDGRQAPIDPRVGSDHVHLEAGHLVLPDPLDRVGHPVHRAGGVDHEGHPAGVRIARRELRPLPAEERDRGHVRHHRDAGLEQAPRGLQVPVARRRGLRHPLHRRAQLALVAAAGAPVELRVAEVVALHQLDQRLGALRPEPGRRSPATRSSSRARPRDRGCPTGSRRRWLPSLTTRSARRRTASGSRRAHGAGPRVGLAQQRPGGERQRRVGPLGGASLRATGPRPRRAGRWPETLPASTLGASASTSARCRRRRDRRTRRRPCRRGSRCRPPPACSAPAREIRCGPPTPETARRGASDGAGRAARRRQRTDARARRRSRARADRPRTPRRRRRVPAGTRGRPGRSRSRGRAPPAAPRRTRRSAPRRRTRRHGPRSRGSRRSCRGP